MNRKMIKRILLIAGALFVVFGVTAFVVMSQQDEIETNGLKVGESAPEFKGTDQQGNAVVLSELLKKGPVVLMFYRGHWCPVCSKHLSQLQDSLQLILDKGASFVAVSPELPQFTEKTISKTGATFTIVNDTTHKIMEDYRVNFTVSKGKSTVYKMFGININKTNGDDSNTLPVPATYIIGTDGEIKWVHFNPDYKERATVKEILNQL